MNNERKPPLPTFSRRKPQQSANVAANQSQQNFVTDDTTLDHIVLKDFRRPAWRLMRSASESHLKQLIDYHAYRAVDDNLDRPTPRGNTSHLRHRQKNKTEHLAAGDLRNPYGIRCNPAWRARTFRTSCDHAPYHPSAQDLLQALMQRASVGIPRYVMEMVSLSVENICDDLPELTEEIQNLADVLMSMPSVPVRAAPRPSAFVHTVADCMQLLGNIACAYGKAQQHAEKRCLKQDARERSMRVLNALIATNNCKPPPRTTKSHLARDADAHVDQIPANVLITGKTDTSLQDEARVTESDDVLANSQFVHKLSATLQKPQPNATLLSI